MLARLEHDRLFRPLLLTIFAVGLVARIVMVAIAPPQAESVLEPLADATDYHTLAISMLEGRGYHGPGGPTAFRPPAYPVFLAAIYAVAGKGNLLAVAAVQVLLGALNVLLIAWLARVAGFRRLVQLFAASMFALYPAFVFQTPQILTEVLARTLLLVACGYFLLMIERACWRTAVVCGALWALAIFNKSVLLAAAPFLGVVSILAWPGGWKSRARLACAFALPPAILLGAWTTRNAVVSGGAFIPVSTNFPITFAQGVTEFSYYTNEWYGEDVELLEVPEDYLNNTQLRFYDDIEDEIATGESYAAQARAWIGENSGVFAILTVRKALHFWGASIRNSPAVRIVALVSMGPVLLGGWVMLAARLRRRRWRARYVLLCLAVALPVTIPYAISQCDVRYRLALIDPLWMVLFAALLARFSMGEEEHTPEQDLQQEAQDSEAQ